jgi:CBS domain-containing protein
MEGVWRVMVRRAVSEADLSISPWTTIQNAAAVMREEDVTALPVLVDGRLVGLLTDRDIVLRLLPDVRNAGDRPVRDAMTTNPVTCFADQAITEAAAIMGDEQIRQLVVLHRSGELAGILSVEDIAEKVSEELAGQVLGEIAERRRCGRRPKTGFKQPE